MARHGRADRAGNRRCDVGRDLRLDQQHAGALHARGLEEAREVAIGGRFALGLDRDLAQPVVGREVAPGGMEDEEGAATVRLERRGELAIEGVELAGDLGRPAGVELAAGGVEPGECRGHRASLDREASRAGPEVRVERRARRSSHRLRVSATVHGNQVDAVARVGDLEALGGAQRAKPRRLLERRADAKEDVRAQGGAHLSVGRRVGLLALPGPTRAATSTRAPPIDSTSHTCGGRLTTTRSRAGWWSDAPAAAKERATARIEVVNMRLAIRRLLSGNDKPLSIRSVGSTSLPC